MLVIDLWSLIEGLTESAKNDGLLNMSEECPEPFRNFLTAEIPNRKLMVFNGGIDADIKTVESNYCKHVADNLNSALAQLFPERLTDPTSNTTSGLAARFRKQFEGLKDDRNQVRAHRLEFVSQRQESARAYQSLDGVARHINVLQSYLKNIYSILTRGACMFDCH